MRELQVRGLPNSSVRLENSSTKSAHNSFPISPIKRDVTKPGGGSHVRHAGAATAPRAQARNRLGPPYRPLLIHQEAEANHRPLLIGIWLVG